MTTRARVLLVALTVVLAIQSRAASAQGADPTADAFFDDQRLHAIRLVINPRDWEELRANFQLNLYYPSHFRWDDQVVRNVGIRSRGTGSRSGAKPGLRVDFNFYDAAQQFLGLKAVVLRNNVQDPTHLHERLGMQLFARLGLPAPREAHARLYVNDEYVGLYSIVENVDKKFLARHFNEDNGYLYEYDYNADDQPYRFESKGPDPAAYSPKPFKPATRETDPDPRPLAELVRVIAEASDAEFTRAVARFLDVDRLMIHTAIESFVSEVDGFVGDYGMNNFYLYRFEGGTRSTILPWDKSEAFKGGVERGIWHNVDDVPSWLQNRLMTRVMRSPEWRGLYLDTLRRCADIVSEPAPLSETDGGDGERFNWLEAEIRRQSTQIRDASYEDQRKPFSDDEFEDGVRELIEFARERSEIVRRDVERSPR